MAPPKLNVKSPVTPSSAVVVNIRQVFVSEEWVK